MVCADVAEYERGSTGEQTQGAGAVAVLVEAEPKLFGVDLAHAGSASDYRGPDFRKPFARHFAEGYAARTRRPSDFPVFSGKYSTFSYLDETVHAVEAMLDRLGVSAGQYYESVKALFFHRPYHLMPIQAMSFLYVRGLGARRPSPGRARSLVSGGGSECTGCGARDASLRPICSPELTTDSEASSPYEATSRAASVLRKQEAFVDLLVAKMSLGSEAVKDVGNLYCAALPAWIAAGLEEARTRNTELVGSPMVAVGYGSGDAAEAWPLHAVRGWREAAARIGFTEALDGALDLSQTQYEALHDRRDAADIDYRPKGEFAHSQRRAKIRCRLSGSGCRVLRVRELTGTGGFTRW